MRLLILPLAAAALSWPSSAAAPAADPAASPAKPRALDQLVSDDCRKTTRYLADDDAGAAYRGKGLKPRKLDELPDATTYMAVYRTVDGCEAPLTMIEYRQGSDR